MIILGIDPGYAIIGWGVIEAKNGRFRPIACGDIRTPAKTPLAYRLGLLYDDLTRVIEKYKPDCMAIEELFFNTNITTAIQVAQARGVLLLAAEKHGLKQKHHNAQHLCNSLDLSEIVCRNDYVALVYHKKSH